MHFELHDADTGKQLDIKTNVKLTLTAPGDIRHSNGEIDINKLSLGESVIWRNFGVDVLTGWINATPDYRTFSVSIPVGETFEQKTIDNALLFHQRDSFSAWLMARVNV